MGLHCILVLQLGETVQMYFLWRHALASFPHSYEAAKLSSPLFSSPLFTWLSFMMDSKFQWYIYTFCKDWCWSWNSNILATWCEELTHFKRPWCWERLRAGGEGDNKEWDGWMASPTQWTWIWVDSGSWWWTGRPGMLWFMGSQKVGHDWTTELNWTAG